MLLTILISTLATVPATIPPRAVLRTPDTQITLEDMTCPKDKVQQAMNLPRARTRNLGELPPGDLYLTVVRRVGNCGISTVIRTRIGETGR